MAMGVASPPVQGATVLHRLARLYEIAIQGATKGATKCNIGCYKLQSPTRKTQSRIREDSVIPLKTAKSPVKPETLNLEL